MVEKNINSILKYWKDNPDVDVNAEEAVRMFVDANNEIKTCTPEQRQELLKSVETYYQEVQNKLTTKNLDVTENTPLFQLFTQLVEMIKTGNKSIDSETKDYLRTLASASLSIYQNNRSRRLGDTSIQRLHTNDTELSYLTELREKVSKKNIEPELQKITEILYSEVRIANRHNMLLNFDMSMDYSSLEGIQLTDDQEYNNTRRLLKERVNNLNRYLAEHQDVDINANKITEILLDSAKAIQKDPAHESKDTQEIINGIIDLSQTAVNRLLNTDLQLEKNSSLCQLILQLTGNAVSGTPAVKETEEEYIKNLAKISLSIRQEDRQNRINLDNEHKIYDNENEYETLKKQREMYKQNNQKGTYATITDCLFAEITKAKTENKIYGFSLPFPLPELKKVEETKVETDSNEENLTPTKVELEELKERIKSETDFLTTHPEENINARNISELFMETAKVKKISVDLAVRLNKLWMKASSRLSKNDLEETTLADTLTHLYKGARAKSPRVTPQEEENLKKLIGIDSFIQEQAKRREEGQSLRLYDNESEFNELKESHQETKFSEPTTQELADRLFKEIEIAYTKDSYEKVTTVNSKEDNQETPDIPKVNEEIVALANRFHGVEDFLNTNPEADINAVELADLLIAASRISKDDSANELQENIEALWLVAYPRMEKKQMTETVVGKTLVNLAVSAINHEPIVTPEEENFLKDVVRIDFFIHQQLEKRQNGEDLHLFDNETEYNQVMTQYQNIHFSNPEIQFQVDQLVNEIKMAYQTDQLHQTPILQESNSTGNEEKPIELENMTNMPIEELANYIYNQRKIMQEIAEESTSIEEYIDRVGSEIIVLPSNDEIEAEIIKIKK
ncbi:MAG TPA: hypothetical protein IAB56_00935 [Candidatus Scybalousia intestinigallinarum]|nr:hypothetical protein [Candidatus Scybalousia intestinigallinarum]